MTPRSDLHLVASTATETAIADFLAAEQALRAARERLGRSLFERRQALELSLYAVSHLLHGSSGTPSDISKLERGVAPRGIGLARAVDEALTRVEAERAAAVKAS